MVLQILVNWSFPMCHEVTGSLSLCPDGRGNRSPQPDLDIT